MRCEKVWKEGYIYNYNYIYKIFFTLFCPQIKLLITDYLITLRCSVTVDLSIGPEWVWGILKISVFLLPRGMQVTTTWCWAMLAQRPASRYHAQASRNAPQASRAKKNILLTLSAPYKKYFALFCTLLHSADMAKINVVTSQRRNQGRPPQSFGDSQARRFCETKVSVSATDAFASAPSMGRTWAPRCHPEQSEGSRAGTWPITLRDASLRSAWQNKH